MMASLAGVGDWRVKNGAFAPLPPLLPLARSAMGRAAWTTAPVHHILPLLIVLMISSKGNTSDASSQPWSRKGGPAATRTSLLSETTTTFHF